MGGIVTCKSSVYQARLYRCLPYFASSDQILDSQLGRGGSLTWVGGVEGLGRRLAEGARRAPRAWRADVIVHRAV